MTSTWRVSDERDDVAVFAGRYDLDVSALNVEAVQEALPRALATLAPTHWVVADPLAFPWEQLAGAQWDAPMDIVLPEDWPPGRLIGAFGRPLFERLMSEDVLVARPWVWAELRARYGWAEAQMRRPAARLENTVRHLVEKARVAARLHDQRELDATTALAWQLRSSLTKARERAEMSIVEPLIMRSLVRRPQGGSAAFLDFSDSVGRYLPPAVRSRASITAVRRQPAHAAQMAYSYPEIQTIPYPLSGDVGLAAEVADVLLVSQGGIFADTEVIARIMAQLWTSLRVGGTMIVVHRPDWPSLYGLDALHEVLLRGTGGSALLESVETVRDPATGRATIGATSYMKIGVPSRW